MRGRRAALAVGGVTAAVLVATGGASAQAIIPADGNGPVVYALPQGGGWVTVGANGLGRTVIGDFAQVKETAYSRDGSELATVALGGTAQHPEFNLYLAEAANGGRDSWLVNFRPENPAVGTWGDVQQATFEADGTHVVFSQVNLSDGFSRILRQNVNSYSPTSAVEISDHHAANNVNPTVAPDGTIAWEYNGQIVTAPAGGGASSVLVASGSNPTYSPNGQSIAFLRNLGVGLGFDLVVADANGANEVVVKHNATYMNSPSWSPDGSALLVKWEGGTGRYIVRFPTNGSAATALSNPRLDPDPATPTEQPIPATPDRVVRLSGSNRIATAIAASAAAFPTDHTADSVVLARYDDFADALSGGALAVKNNGPMLLNPTDTLDASVATEIGRVINPAGSKKVFLLGGVGALSASIATDLTTAGYTVVRLSGANRFETSVAVATELGTANDILLATGKNYPDALSASAAAASYWGFPGATGAAVLLTDNGVMPPSVAAYIAAQKVANANLFVTTIGGAAEVADPSADLALTGGDRYQTSTLVAEAFFNAPTTIGLATGTGFADALAGAAVVGARNGPLLLTPAAFLPGGKTTDSVDNYLHWMSASINQGLIFGGTGVVSAAVESATQSAIGVNTIALVGGPISGTPAITAKASGAHVVRAAKGHPSLPRGAYQH